MTEVETEIEHLDFVPEDLPPSCSITKRCPNDCCVIPCERSATWRGRWVPKHRGIRAPERLEVLACGTCRQLLARQHASRKLPGHMEWERL